jgi:hypothetical protein
VDSEIRFINELRELLRTKPSSPLGKPSTPSTSNYPSSVVVNLTNDGLEKFTNLQSFFF